MTPDPLPDPLRTVTTYIYDAQKRVVSMVDPPAWITWVIYDTLERVGAQGKGPPTPPPEEPPDEPHIVE